MYGQRILLGVRKRDRAIFETNSLAVHKVQENILQRMLPEGWFNLQETRLSRVWNRAGEVI
jgi:hypothetical protein